MVIDLQGKRATVFGLGLNDGGVGTVRFLVERGAREIVVTDLKTETELASSLEKLKDIPNIRYVLGHHNQTDFTETDLVIKSPGVPWNNQYVRCAQEAGVPVEVDSGLFFRLCPCPIIGVTGSKGKTTTSVLLVALLRASGCDVVEAGIGQTAVLGQLAKTKPDSVVVFELSSWRLAGLREARMSPHVAVFTNFFPDHMNYYRSLDEYFNDKRVIFQFQNTNDRLVYDADGEYFKDYLIREGVLAEKLMFSLTDAGIDPLVFARGDEIVFRQNGTEHILLHFSETKLKGEHNRKNMLAALAGALAYGAEAGKCAQALREFSGIPHRLEFVTERDGVKYYNDTAATVPEAVMMALRAFDEPIVLIAGGADKNLDFEALAYAIIRRVKHLILFRGAATEKLLVALRGVWPEELPFPEKIPIVGSMKEAVQIARSETSSGDVVLLSPGAASFGLFQNEFDRGEQFKKEV